ncbi:MAG: helix-turn-helix transcriptional regulator [Baekduia sp.]
MPDGLQTIAARIRDARVAKSWTQHDAAAAIGMGMAQYGRIERGDVEPGIMTFVRVAHGLEVDPGDLLRGPR